MVFEQIDLVDMVGLINWVFKAIAASGTNVNVEFATGLSIPVIVLLVAVAVRRARSRVDSSEDETRR